jgi:hypothetical protein
MTTSRTTARKRLCVLKREREKREREGEKREREGGVSEDEVLNVPNSSFVRAKLEPQARYRC